MSEYITIQDEAELKAGNKKIKIIGSLSEVMHNLLNEVYHDKESSIAKRQVSTFEEYDTDGIDHDDLITIMKKNIDKTDKDTVIYALKPSDMDFEFIQKLNTSISLGKDVHLVTDNTVSRESIDAMNHCQQKRTAFEDYVLKKGGYVYRIVSM